MWGLPVKRNKRLWLFGVVIAVLVLGIIFLWYSYKDTIENGPVTIVLAPHYDDAVLPLGAMLVKSREYKVVATFFTGGPVTSELTNWDRISGFKNSGDAPAVRTQENTVGLKRLDADIQDYQYQDYQYGRTESEDELRVELSKDIQALIASFSNRAVHVYGPSIFKDPITHPDHALLHKAYLDVIRSYPNSNVTFSFYEDYPYIERFNESSVISLEKNLENQTGLYLNKREILLTPNDLRGKINAFEDYASQVNAFDTGGKDSIQDLEKFTSERCGDQGACEVVYDVVRF